MNKRTEIRLSRPRVVRLLEWVLSFSLALSVVAALTFTLLRWVVSP